MASVQDQVDRRGTRMFVVAASVLLALALTACGGGGPTGPTDADGSVDVDGGGLRIAIDPGQDGVTHFVATVQVEGTATPDATITLDDHPASGSTLASLDGRWSLPVQLEVGTNELVFRASLDGEEATADLVLHREAPDDGSGDDGEFSP